MKPCGIKSCLAILVVGLVLSVTPGAAEAGSTPTHAKYRSGLSGGEIRSIMSSVFADIPRYPGSYTEPGMSSHSPGSFSMVTFGSRKGTVSGIARYYRERLTARGWNLLDSYGTSKEEYRVAGAATLTFGMVGRSLSLDITRVNRNLVQYTLISYDSVR